MSCLNASLPPSCLPLCLRPSSPASAPAFFQHSELACFLLWAFALAMTFAWKAWPLDSHLSPSLLPSHLFSSIAPSRIQPYHSTPNPAATTVPISCLCSPLPQSYHHFLKYEITPVLFINCFLTLECKCHDDGKRKWFSTIWFTFVFLACRKGTQNEWMEVFAVLKKTEPHVKYHVWVTQYLPDPTPVTWVSKTLVMHLWARDSTIWQGTWIRSVSGITGQQNMGRSGWNNPESKKRSGQPMEGEFLLLAHLDFTRRQWQT